MQMPKLTEYPQATGFDANDILIKDGTGGTKKITIEDFIAAITDGTLTAVDKVAPASAVGKLNSLVSKNVNDVSLWEQGGIGSGNGANQADTDANYAKTIRTIGAIPDGVSDIIVKPGYKYGLFIYKSNTAFGTPTYVGYWKDSAITTNATGSFAFLTTNTDLTAVRRAAAQLQTPIEKVYFRVNIRMDTNITPSTASNGVEFVEGPATLSEAAEYINAQPIRIPEMTGLPTLELEGDITGISKETEVNLTYRFVRAGNTMAGDPEPPSGACKLKWQGSSSQRYAKKNFTFKIDDNSNAFDGWLEWLRSVNAYRTTISTGSTTKLSYANPRYAGTDHDTRWWGEKKKYCLKANFVDSSHARNIVSARLWGQMVSIRSTLREVEDARADAPNYGAIDGFPIEVKINGESQGLYTFTIPKDKWMMSMGAENTEYIIGGEKNESDYCKWNFAFGSTAIENFAPWVDWASEQHTRENEKVYDVGDIVLYDKTDIFRCVRKTDTRSSVTPPNPLTAAYWEKLSNYDPSGVSSWVDEESGSEKVYDVNDVVLYNGEVYKCILETTARAGANPPVPPNAANYWEVLFDIEYTKADSAESAKTAFTSLNNALAEVAAAGDGWDTDSAVASKLDVDSAFDYFIFTLCIANEDAMAKNILYGTYDGTKWFMSAYDMDTTFGSNPYGTDLFTTAGSRCRWTTSGYKLVDLMKAYSPVRLKKRWDMWRKGASSVDVSSYHWGETGKFINLAGKTPEGSAVSLEPTSAGSGTGRYLITPCEAGWEFRIKTVGGSSARAYAFLDSNNKIVDTGEGGIANPADASTTLDGTTTIIAPAGAVKLIVNDTNLQGSVELIAAIPAVLSEENVFNVLSGFTKDIPTRDYDIDREIWPELPLTSSDTVARYIEYYRMHVAQLDKQIEAMQPVGNG